MPRLAVIGLLTLVGVLGAGYVLLPVAAWAFVRVLTAALNGSVWLAAAIGSGEDMWTITTTVVNAASNALTTPQTSGGIVALVLLGAAALFGLQRLFGSEEDPSQ